MDKNTGRGKILICGASIAGPCLAYWLNRAGFETHIIERAPKFRDGGQNIDISGPAKQVVELMGLTAAIKESSTREAGLRFVNAKGDTVAEFPQSGDSTFTRELEIRRGDLSRIFFDATKAATTYRFGLAVRTLHPREEGIGVELTDGTKEEYDLVISAEGVGSATRKLLMDEFVKLNYLGLWMAYFRIPKLPSDDLWARWYNAPGGRVILLRPSSRDAMSAAVDFLSDDAHGDHQPVEAQREKVKKVLSGMGWQAERISAGLSFDDDFYLGPVSQVKASRWSKGRFALVGDAAYGPSPITGKGTSLAILGAYVLAGELAANQDALAALKAYEKRLRPYVEKCQQLPPGVPRVAHPRTKLGIALLNGAAAAVGSRPVRTIRKLVASKAAPAEEAEGKDFELPRYAFSDS
ncbi:MAG: FAD-binding monooxygenase [Proteobacteria bacterium]|nr:MAG: FAD-binding monooxygenase [Pseudomonadota bacterium]